MWNGKYHLTIYKQPEEQSVNVYPKKFSLELLRGHLPILTVQEDVYWINCTLKLLDFCPLFYTFKVVNT